MTPNFRAVLELSKREENEKRAVMRVVEQEDARRAKPALKNATVGSCADIAKTPDPPPSPNPPNPPMDYASRLSVKPTSPPTHNIRSTTTPVDSEFKIVCRIPRDLNFGQKLDFWSKFRFLVKISIFG